MVQIKKSVSNTQSLQHFYVKRNLDTLMLLDFEKQHNTFEKTNKLVLSRK